MMGHSYKVLVVDDNPATRRGLKLLLSLEQDVTEILEAKDGSEAERLAHDETPDVVLLDVRMPGMSGIELTRRIKGDSPDVFLVAMSMVAESEHAALSAGADLFLEKTELVADIRAVLRHGSADLIGSVSDGSRSGKPGLQGG